MWQIYEYDTKAQLQIFAEFKQPVSIYIGILQHTNNISAALFCLGFMTRVKLIIRHFITARKSECISFQADICVFCLFHVIV